MGELVIQQKVRLTAPKYGVQLWRNNTGVLKDLRGVPVRFGLANDSAKLNERIKSSDLLGWRWDGRFVAIECKPPHWKGVRTAREMAQERFIDMVNQAGGCAGFCVTLNDFMNIIQLRPNAQ